MRGHARLQLNQVCRRHNSSRLITNNDETAYREEVRALGVCCQENILTQRQQNEMIVDFRKQQREHPPIHINGTAVEHLRRLKKFGLSPKILRLLQMQN